MQRTRSPLGLLLSAVVVGLGARAATAQDAAAERPAAAVAVSPFDAAWPLWDELSRRVPPGPNGAPGRGEAGWPLPLRTAEGVGGATAARLETWLAKDVTPDAPSLWLRPELVGVLRGSDPHRQLEPAYADVRAGEAVDPAVRPQLVFLLRAGLLPRVQAQFRLRLDTEGRNDPRNRTEDFPQLGTSNDIDEAYVRATWGATTFTFGRMALAWGPSPHGPLLLSPTAPAPDLLHVNLRWGARGHLQAFAGELSSEPDPSDNAVRIRRYLYGHRADVWPTRWLRVALSETAVVAGRDESLSLRFANPVQFYAQAQSEEDGNDEQQVNVFDAIDAEAFVGQAHVYVSLVVDDLQIDAAGRKRSPDQLAWAVGCTAAPSPRSPWWGGLELRRVGSWFGLHDGAGTDYRTFQRPVGAPEGPDTERQIAFVSRWMGEATRARLDLEHRRRGINRVTTEESRSGHAGEAFPRGPVERRLGVHASLQQWIGGTASLTGEVAWTTIDHVDNGPDGLSVWELWLTVDLRAPALRWRPVR